MVQVAIADLAKRLSVEPSKIEVSDVFDVRWADGSLGLPEPGMAYIQVILPGQVIRLRAGERLYQYHAGPGGVRFAGRVHISPDLDFEGLSRWGDDYREDRAIEAWGWLTVDPEGGLLFFERPAGGRGLRLVNAAYPADESYRWFEIEEIGEGHWAHLWGAVQGSGEEGYEEGLIGLIRAELVEEPPPVRANEL